jgi:DNA-binding CsgD family transcriptional regulator
VVVRDAERPQLLADRLVALFGLTPTEAAIAVELSAGLSTDEIAPRLQIAVGTVRWHLKRILAKTGSSRQAELVALLLRSVAAMP